MSEAKTLNSLLSQLPAVTDPTGKSVLLTDTAGQLAKIAASILGVTYAKSDAAGAAILGGTYRGSALVLAIDSSDKSKVLLYTFVKPLSAETGKATVILSEGGLDVGLTNQFGTVALKGFTSGDSVVQHVLRFA